VELAEVRGVSGNDAAGWDEDGSKRHPESAIRRERGGTKDVSTGELPHAGEKLDKTTGKDGHAYNHVRNRYSTGLDIDEGEDESCRGEGEETKGTRVGNGGGSLDGGAKEARSFLDITVMRHCRSC